MGKLKELESFLNDEVLPSLQIKDMGTQKHFTAVTTQQLADFSIDYLQSASGYPREGYGSALDLRSRSFTHRDGVTRYVYTWRCYGVC